MKGGPICEAIAWNMMAARKEKGMPIKELINRSRIASSSVRAWEANGFVGNIDHLARLHEALGLPLWELLPAAEEVEDLMDEEY